MNEQFPQPPADVQKPEDVTEDPWRIKRALLQAQIERLGSWYASKPHGKSFADYVEEQTQDDEGHGGLLSSIAKRMRELQQEISYETICNTINGAHSSGGSRGVIEYLNTLIDLLPSPPEEGDPERIVNNCVVENAPRFLHAAGYMPDDTLMELHVDFVYKHPNAHLRESIMKDLAAVAVDIVQNHPETQGVFGESWLMDTGIARKLGFHILDTNHVSSKHVDRGSVRLLNQAVTRDGDIRSDVMRAYATGGQLKYSVRVGHMPTNEFVYRYYPHDNYQGSVTVLEHNNETREVANKIREEEKQLEQVVRTITTTVRAGNTPDMSALEHLEQNFSTEMPHLSAFLMEHNLSEVFTLVRALIAEMKITQAEAEDAGAAQHVSEKVEAWSTRYKKVFRSFAYSPKVISWTQQA